MVAGVTPPLSDGYVKEMRDSRHRRGKTQTTSPDPPAQELRMFQARNSPSLRTMICQRRTRRAYSVEMGPKRVRFK
ncbi:hypothetical protein I7I50_08344 [Histoplasma capsulatum G186AR]|uniref:Uncharacterized protein n=1 Tax=Ajellomyces capsulatus TaxID=5037 RepID=A0A8H7YTW8_AJECA|nr:hypothetical protein I7I52_05860 [Histoplasma capsulatum]QSS73540.1 hypothetical protein I7I50_08344 [Histoplasma capsulatum G186AR]